MGTRIFNSGATRDTTEGKLSYSRFLSPVVLKRYCEYLDKHRVQADGNLREPDNWKNGIPMDVYLDSLLRHVVDVWLHIHEYHSETTETMKDSICAIIFNSMGMLYEMETRKSTYDKDGDKNDI